MENKQKLVFHPKTPIFILRKTQMKIFFYLPRMASCNKLQNTILGK